MESKFGNLIIQTDTRLFRGLSLINGIIYVSSGYDSPALYAIRCGGRGDITQKTHLVWKTRKAAPRNSSVVVVEGCLFMAADNGVVSCLDAKTGELYWMERVAGSPAQPLYFIANGQNLFYAMKVGRLLFLKAQKEYSLIGTQMI